MIKEQQKADSFIKKNNVNDLTNHNYKHKEENALMDQVRGLRAGGSSFLVADWVGGKQQKNRSWGLV